MDVLCVHGLRAKYTNTFTNESTQTLRSYLYLGHMQQGTVQFRNLFSFRDVTACI